MEWDLGQVPAELVSPAPRLPGAASLNLAPCTSMTTSELL